MAVNPELTVKEAGRKGGEATRDRHGHEHFVRLGRQVAERVKALVAKGKELEAREAHDR